MRREQKIVAIGAASGVAGMALSIWMLTYLLPSPGIDSLAERLAHVLRINVYRMHPLSRAPGMSSTAYLNLWMIVYVLYHVTLA